MKKFMKMTAVVVAIASFVCSTNVFPNVAEAAEDTYPDKAIRFILPNGAG